jgi:CheY-like chemotaxis protein/HPt (histidine-containing phosphotransfer) domain-containing protein
MPLSQSDLLDAIATFVSRTADLLDDTHIPAELTPTSWRPLRVLLAEDNEVNQMLAVHLLSKRGHTVVVTGNGLEALAAYEQDRFDLILMDIQMPEMNGLEATQFIRQREVATGTHTPIIAMTARAMQGDREECIAAGMDAYVSKPVQFAALFETIQQLIPDLDRGQMAAASAPAVPESNPLNETKPPVVDRQSLLERVGGDMEFLRQVAEVFFDTWPTHLAQMQEAVAAQDSRQLQEVAHALKGAVGGLQAMAAYEAALRLEQLGRSGDMSGAESALARLQEEVRQLKAALNDMVSEAVGNC